MKLNIGVVEQLRNLFGTVLSPVTGGAWWYVTAYFWLALICPTINKLIKNFSDKQLVACLVLVLFGYVIDSHTGTKFIDLQRAILYYLIGCFCKRNQGKKIQKKSSFLLFLITWLVISMMIYYTLSADTSTMANKIIVRFTVSFSNLIMTPLCAFFAFNLFSQCSKIKNDIVNKIGKTTFGIYLFHDSFIAQILIWNVIFDVKNTQFVSNLFPIYAICTVCSIFIVGMIVDILRDKYINPIFERIYILILIRIGFVNKHCSKNEAAS